MESSQSQPDNSNITRAFSMVKSFFHEPGFEALQQLAPPERLFAYYMSQAAAAGYQIALHQLCPCPDVIHDIVKAPINDLADEQFCNDLESWRVFLISNYGVHFVLGHDHNKKTPKQLKLKTITRESLQNNLGVHFEEWQWQYLLDPEYQHTATVSKNIEASGNAFYGPGVTTEMYNKLPEETQKRLNAYYTANNDGTINQIPYCIENGHLARQLIIVIGWVNLAAGIARKHPEFFDEHTHRSLDLMIEYMLQGEEVVFREHCKEWLQMNNPKVEYCIGFIEYYEDPMGRVGTWQADVTIKSVAMQPLLQLLPQFEQRFPFPREWKRDDMSKLPNAAGAHKVMGTGGCGPMLRIIAYCLPNYDDIRSQLGSKQVMYSLTSSSGEELERYKQIFLDDDTRNLYNRVSGDMKLDTMIKGILTTLHETIGHASGALANNLDKAEQKTRVGKWCNGLEEMRAEILALYTATHFYDELAEAGCLDEWPQHVPKEDMLKLLILNMLDAGWRRWGSMPPDSTEVTQAHALADTGILYYMLDHCGPDALEMTRDRVTMYNDQNQSAIIDVLRIKIHDLAEVMRWIEMMAYTVQKLSSTAITDDVNAFMTRYAASTRNSDYPLLVSRMINAYKGGSFGSLQLFPQWEPIIEDDHIVDAIPHRPTDVMANLLFTYF